MIIEQDNQLVEESNADNSAYEISGYDKYSQLASKWLDGMKQLYSNWKSKHIKGKYISFIHSNENIEIPAKQMNYYKTI